MESLTTNLKDSRRRPYFLWDEDLTTAEFRSRLRTADEPERLRLIGKLLREARDTDAWEFVTPQEVARLMPSLRRHLGRRAAFWGFLIEGWRADGLLV